MTELEMRELVSSMFVAEWSAAAPSVPLALENEALPSADTFALMTILPTTSQQATLGARGTMRVQRNGWIQVKLWTPANQGTSAAASLVDIVRSIVELVTLRADTGESLTTLASSIQPVGTDGRWYMLVVRTPFWYCETR